MLRESSRYVGRIIGDLRIGVRTSALSSRLRWQGSTAAVTPNSALSPVYLSVLVVCACSVLGITAGFPIQEKTPPILLLPAVFPWWNSDFSSSARLSASALASLFFSSFLRTIAAYRSPLAAHIVSLFLGPLFCISSVGRIGLASASCAYPLRRCISITSTLLRYAAVEPVAPALRHSIVLCSLCKAAASFSPPPPTTSQAPRPRQPRELVAA